MRSTCRRFRRRGGKWQISKSGGMHPKWRRDGKELFYLGAGGKIMAVGVTTGATYKAAFRKRLFETGTSGKLVAFALTANGRRSLVPIRLRWPVSPPARLVTT